MGCTTAEQGLELFMGVLLAKMPEGPKRSFPTVFLRFLALACDRGKQFQRDKECPTTAVFLGMLVPSALADPGHPLNTPRLTNTV